MEPFWDRPYVHLNRSLVPALLETLNGPEVRALPEGVGSVEQQTDNVDILTKPTWGTELSADCWMWLAHAPGPGSTLLWSPISTLTARSISTCCFGRDGSVTATPNRCRCTHPMA